MLKFYKTDENKMDVDHTFLPQAQNKKVRRIHGLLAVTIKKEK